MKLFTRHATLGATGLATLMLAGLGTTAAHAQTPNSAVGFVWTDGLDQPPANASFNSSGGTNTLTSLGAGRFQIIFPGLGNGLNSNVQVNAFDAAGNCTSDGWYSSNGVDVQVDVDCFTSAGAPYSGRFSVLYQARTGWTGSGGAAFLWADQPSAASYTPDSYYSFDSAGGTNTITRTGTGTYTATLPGLTQAGGTVLVSSYASVESHCTVMGWGQNAGGTTVNIACVDVAGQPADEYFNLAYSVGATAGYGPSSAAGAYAWMNNIRRKSPYTPAYAFQFNSISPGFVTAQHDSAKGEYSVFIPAGAAHASSLAMVSAFGQPGVSCNVVAYDTTIADVICFDHTGKRANSLFDLTMQTGN